MIFTFLPPPQVNTLKSDTVSIPVLHCRASKALERVMPLVSSDTSFHVDLTADDVTGEIRAKGPTDQIRTIRQYIALFDVERRTVSFKLKIQSRIDKINYEVSAKILNMQEWKTSDSDTGIAVGITPRINDGGTVTMAINFSRPGIKINQMVLRLMAGSHATLSVDSKSSISWSIQKDGTSIPSTAVSSDPTITIELCKL